MSTPLRLVLSLIVAISASSLIAAETVIFADDFDRKDTEKPDNGWVLIAEFSGAAIKDKTLTFAPEDAEFEPRVSHTFPVQEKDAFTVSFAFDWVRDFEQEWAFYIQLGSSKAIPQKLTDESDLGKGIAVNLVWGGGYTIGFEGEFAILAHVKGDKFSELAVINNKEEDKTVLIDNTFTIKVDPKTSTYSVTVGDKTHKALAFDNKVPIDTIRFIAHKVNPSNFTAMSIDDVKIVKKK